MRGTYSLAVYGPWEVAYTPTGRLGVPVPQPQIDGFALIDIEADLVDGTPPSHARILVFVCNAGPDLWNGALAELETRGYASHGHAQRPRCRLEDMRRPPG
jgi:hypothetical protein